MKPIIKYSLLALCVFFGTPTYAQAQCLFCFPPPPPPSGPPAITRPATTEGPTLIGYPAGQTSFGTAISYDGLTAGGLSQNSNGDYTAFTWTSAVGYNDLGLAPGSVSSNVNGLSADGSAAAASAQIGSYNAAFRWTQSTGFVSLGTFGGNNSGAYGISKDGAIVVGYADIPSGESHAFRWTQGTGIVDLGQLPGYDSSVAQGISGDNNVIVGYSYDSTTYDSAGFRWTQAGGMVDLGTLPGGSHTRASGVSSDGTYIVGRTTTFDGYYAPFRWDATNGIVDLRPAGSTDYGQASAISADGSIVVGDSGNNAFRWTETDNLQDLKTLMNDAGIDMTGITLTNATAISGDGSYIVGSGIFPSGPYTQAYLLRYIPLAGGGAIAGVTTPEAQAKSVATLSDTQAASVIGTRSASNVMLGALSPIATINTVSTGAMIGSAVGYTSAQYYRDGFTLLGGIGYGSQEYDNAELHNAPLFAAALRYSFAPENTKLIPFVELGGSLSPDQDVTFKRSYANGAGTSTGKGDTNTVQGLWYGRGGLAWNITTADQLTGYGDLGRYLSYDGYSEKLSSVNPFPATIGDGTSTMDVGRLGGSWTHKLNHIFSLTGSAALAHAFNIDSSLNANVEGAGAVHASGRDNFTWAEYGAKLETRLTDMTRSI